MAHHRDVSTAKNTLAVGPDRLAGDGTVIEAACSHYNLLKEESVRSRVSKAKARHQQAPQEQQGETQRQLDKALDCEQHLDGRVEHADTVRVSPTESEAVIQKQKRGRGFAPAYTPSVSQSVRGSQDSH